MDWGISEVMPFLKDVETRVPCIELEIELGHILFIISFLDTNMMASLGIGIRNWIGGISEVIHMFKDVKTVSFCFMMINAGHIPYDDISGYPYLL